MFKIFNASVTGNSHMIRDISNQDAVFSDVRSGVTFISLADGAGSLKGAGICAETVVREVSCTIADNFPSLLAMDSDQTASEIGKYITGCMEKLSHTTGLPPEQLGSTYLFAGSDGKNFLIVHLGDGAILGKTFSGTNGIISVPEGSEDGKATFLTCSANLANHIRVTRADYKDYCEIILISDGMHNAAFDKDFISRHDFGSSYKQLLDMAIMDINADDSSYIMMRSSINGK